MNKEQLLDVLLDLGLAEAYDDLYDEDVTVRDWVSRNEDLVRSNRAIAQAIQVDAPHDVKEGYFKDKDEQRQYEAGEKKYNEERAKKQQLADEYQRAKDIEDFSKFAPFDSSFGHNLAALGMMLTPQVAKNVYIKEGYNPSKIGAQAGIGTVANVAEFLPLPGKLGKAIATFSAPVIRAGQDIYEGKDLSEVRNNFVFDTGLNSLFSYMPVKEVYNYVKRVLGQGGEAGEKVLKGNIDEVLEQADLLENKDEALKNLREQEKKLNQYKDAYSKASDLDRAKLIKDVENTHPDLAKAVEEHANALGEKRFVDKMAGSDKAKDINVKAVKQQAYEFYAEQFGPEQAKEIVDSMTPADCINFLKKRTTDIVNETAKDVGIAFTNAEMRNFEKQAALNDELFNKAGNLKIGVENLSEAAAYALPNKLSKRIATVAPAVRGVARTVVTPSRKSAAPEDKEYDSALEYIIQSNKRQWNAGFKPHGGIELEAWQIAKDRGEI